MKILRATKSTNNNNNTMASVIPSNLAQTARRLLQSSTQSSKTGLYVTRRTFAAAGDKFNREKVSKK